ncbi:DUF6510 family protein [Streptomyces sp. NPDC056628]|uniref:DUF6510 family protein n=1 Tax=Streptomyces sp. NPDC056628 TaxID=3345882 RepID=UPI0036A734B8
MADGDRLPNSARNGSSARADVSPFGETSRGFIFTRIPRPQAFHVLHVCGPDPGLTARCAHCSRVALRLVRHEEDTWLTPGGAEGAFRFRAPTPRRRRASPSRAAGAAVPHRPPRGR